MSEFNMHGFKAQIRTNDVTVDGLSFTPGSEGRITGLLAIANRMGSLKALPPFISHDPFHIFFKEDGSLFLRRDGEDTGVKFNFSNIDGLITIVQEVVKSHVDLQRLRPQPRATGVTTKEPGDVYEGRG